MKRLVCEMCGSTDLIKDKGVFVCQSCGCKYTVEEARSMMVEGTVEVTGTVTVNNNNSRPIENYLQMAENALNSTNNEEAENYANKIIEVEPQHAQAWFIKGKAAGWQTTGKTNRFPECVTAWVNAYTFAAEDEKRDMAEKIKAESASIATAIMSMKADSFKSFPRADSADEIKNTILLIGFQLILLESKTGINAYSNTLKTSFADLLNGSAAVIFIDAEIEFGPEKKDRNQFAWNRYTTSLDSCLSVLETAYSLSEEDDTSHLICKNYITIAKAVRDSCSYKLFIGYLGTGYDVDYSFTAEAKNARTKKIREYERNMSRHDPGKRQGNKNSALKSIKDAHELAGKEFAISKYWEAHASEKRALDKELNELDEKRSRLQSELESNPDRSEAGKIGGEISELNRQMSSLGAFKGKEKKELSARIEKLEAEKKPYQEKWDAISKNINDEIKTLDERKKEINGELTKDRGAASPVPKRYIELFKGAGGNITGSELLEYFKEVLPQRFTVNEFTYNEYEGRDRQYMIKFAKSTAPTNITFKFEAVTEDSPIKDRVSYGITLDDHTQPANIADFVQVVTSSIAGICPDIEIGTLEEGIVNTAYGFDNGLTLDADNIHCTVSRAINSSLDFRLARK